MILVVSVSERLAAARIDLPAAPPPAGVYGRASRAGGTIHVSGQVPWSEGRLLARGQVGVSVGLETAVVCARQCALNALAAVAATFGPGVLDDVVAVTQVRVFIAAGPDFVDHVQVADGATDLLRTVLPDAGLPARSAVGVTSLPLGAPVEIELQLTTTPGGAP